MTYQPDQLVACNEVEITQQRMVVSNLRPHNDCIASTHRASSPTIGSRRASLAASR
jgi:hypothetical protein